MVAKHLLGYTRWLVGCCQVVAMLSQVAEIAIVFQVVPRALLGGC